MLGQLHIENLAVIAQADIAFGSGLTVLSGETGAGKSIVLDAIGALLGHRTSRDLVRAGAREGLVRAQFTDLAPQLTEVVRELGLNGEDSTLTIERRFVAGGRSTCRVNGKSATQATLRQLAPFLVDLHGQNDGQKLLDDSHHIDYLDGYADNAARLAEYRTHYEALRRLRGEITALDAAEQQRRARLDALREQSEELTAAQLTEGEEQALREKKACFDQAGRVAGALEHALVQLTGADEQGGACAALRQAAEAVRPLSAVAHTFVPLAEHADEVYCLADELQSTLRQALGELQFSAAAREQVEARLDELYRLRQKYGATEQELIALRAHAQTELDALHTADTHRDDLRAQYRAHLTQAKSLAWQIGRARARAAHKLEKEVVRELRALDMDKVRMRIELTEGAKLTANGINTVRFLLSVNPGEPEKPLSKVASGGELSRIMLALKTVLSAGDEVGTMIFDEIDTGVSGHAAQQIAKKLIAIGQNKQTLCVTHLPQIAAMGTHHLLLQKSVREGQSFTEVHRLDGQARVDEVARLLSGEQISRAARDNAAELLRDAHAYALTLDEPHENGSADEQQDK